MTINMCITIFISIIIISRCTYLEEKKYEKNIKRDVARLYESELVISESISTIDSVSLPEVFYSNLHRVQIISWLNGNCQACINNLRRWEEELIRGLNPSQVNFIFIIYMDDYEYFKNVIFPDISLDIPIFIDANNDFINANGFYDLDNFLLTFLIDFDGKIKLVGNPLMNKELQTLYFQEINKLIQSEQ